MDISTKKPGWEKFEWEGVTCDIKRLTNEEGMEVKAALQKVSGQNLFSRNVREILFPHVQKIKGLKVDGVAVKELKDIFDPQFGQAGKLDDFYFAVTGRFFEMYNVTEEEVKNSAAPPVG